jgi:hypothetical protein
MRSRLTAVGDEPAEMPGLAQVSPPQAIPKRNSWTDTAAIAGIMLAFKALTQKTIIALASLVELMVMGSVFWMTMDVIGQPTPLQLVGLAGYAIFVLVCLYIRRRNVG